MASTRHLSASRRLVGAIAGGAALVLSACGSPSSTPVSGNVANCGADSPVTLNIEDYSPTASLYQLVADQYHKECPNVTISWTHSSQAAYLQSLPLQFSSHQAPDVFFDKSQVDPTQTMAELLAQGFISPVNPGTDGTDMKAWEARWPTSLGQAFSEGINEHNGKVYSFPFTDNKVWGPGYLYWNKKLFTQAKLDPNKPPTTWSELTADCKAIKDVAGKYCMVNPMKAADGSDTQRLWYSLAGTQLTDQPFFDFKTGTFDINEQPMIDTFNYVKSLNDAGYLVPGLYDKNAARTDVEQGTAAMLTDGAWIPGQVFNIAGFSNYGAAAAPHPDSGRPGAYSQLPSQNLYYVSSQTTHAEAAWRFLYWMTDPAGFFAKNYLQENLGTLAYVAPDQMTSIMGSSLGPQMAQVIKIGSSPGFRVQYPVPLLQCPDLAKGAGAFGIANKAGGGSTAEWNAISTALTQKQDFKALVDPIATAKTAALNAELTKEAATGLKVSINCYKFPNWSYTKDFPVSSYSPPQ